MVGEEREEIKMIIKFLVWVILYGGNICWNRNDGGWDGSGEN